MTKDEVFELSRAGADALQEELEKLKIEFQELFLEVMKININKVETRQDIEKIIYDFRYYLLIPYNYEKRIQNI